MTIMSSEAFSTSQLCNMIVLAARKILVSFRFEDEDEDKEENEDQGQLLLIVHMFKSVTVMA